MNSSYHNHQKYLILNLINHLGPTSRTKLIELTDYRPASVGAIIKELIEEKLLLENGFFSSGHGRKRALLEINKNHLCAIGISFSSSLVRFIVAQQNGSILLQQQLTFSPNTVLEELAKQIIETVCSLLQTFPDKQIVGIGIGDPLYSQLSYSGDGASYNHFKAWIHETLMPQLQQAVPVAVCSFSAVALPALVEQRFGVGVGCENFFCVELSNGIGCSICCNGTVVSGATGTAGELGHTVVDGAETVCYCGKCGCVECSSAFPAISSEIRSAMEQGVYSLLSSFCDQSRDLSVQEIRRAIDEGDQLCRRVVKRAANRIGLAIANSINLLNPELVVLYGFMLELGDFFVQNLEESIQENVLLLASNYKIQISEQLESMLPLGAAAQMFSVFLRTNDFSWVYRMQPSETNDEDSTEEPSPEYN